MNYFNLIMGLFIFIICSVNLRIALKQIEANIKKIKQGLNLEEIRIDTRKIIFANLGALALYILVAVGISSAPDSLGYLYVSVMLYGSMCSLIVCLKSKDIFYEITKRKALFDEDGTFLLKGKTARMPL